MGERWNSYPLTVLHGGGQLKPCKLLILNGIMDGSRGAGGPLCPIEVGVRQDVPSIWEEKSCGVVNRQVASHAGSEKENFADEIIG